MSESLPIVVGVLSGLVVSGGLTFARYVTDGRHKEQDRAEQVAEFRGAVNSELSAVHARLARIEERLDTLATQQHRGVA